MKAHDRRVLERLDRTIARLELRAEQQRIHVAALANYSVAERLRQHDIHAEMTASLSRLRTYRHSFIEDPKAS